MNKNYTKNLLLKKWFKTFYGIITINHNNFFQNFWIIFLQYIKIWIVSDIKIIKMKISRQNIDTIYEKVKNSLLQLEKDFKELRDKEKKKIEK